MFTQLSNPVKATIFYALAFTMALLVALFGQGMGEIILLISMFITLVAVLLMLLVVTRDGYTRAGWEMLGLHRLGLSSWPLAIGGPMLVLGTTYGIIWAAGVGRLNPAGSGGPIDFAFVMNFLLGFAIGIVAAMAEEIGWRGYLLSNLLPMENRAQANNSQGRLRALLLSGFLQGLWHLPLMLLTPFYHADGNRFIVVTLFLLTLTAAGIFYGYLRLVSESTWPAAIAHNVFNTIWETLSKLTVPVASPLLLSYLAGESGILTLAGVIVLSAWLLYRLQRKSQADPTVKVLVNQPLHNPLHNTKLGG